MLPASSFVRAAFCAAAFALCAPSVEAREPWVVFKDCRLVSQKSADADSFHVQADGKEYIFRLYFVDAPETGTEFPARVDEQAKYFSLTPPQAIQLGNYAKRFTREKLNSPFTVRTCLQDAMGRSKMNRYYAFVETQEGDLAELLVTNGLARLHGSTAAPLGLSSPERMWEKLKRLERAARQEKVGAWGASSGRLAVRSKSAQPKSGPDSFPAFFHAEKLAATAAGEAGTPSPRTQLASIPLGAGAGFDVNTASSAELLRIPGVGPVLAQRIVEARPFATADELRRVKGIGEKTYARIRPHFQ